MSSFLNKIKAGVKLAPASLIVLYLLFFILDSVTTYIASPDLKYESNWLVVLLNLDWLGIIIKDTLIFTVVSASLILSLNFLNDYSIRNLFNGYKDLVLKSFKDPKLLISIIFIGMFFSHILNLGHIILNNYLAYVFLHQTNGWIKSFATYYISNQKYFLFYIQYLLIIPGYIIAIYRVRLINKRIFQNNPRS